MFKDAKITIYKVQFFVFVSKDYTASYNANTMQFWVKEGSASAGEGDGSALALAPWGQGLRASKDFKKPAGTWTVKGKLADGSKMASEAFDDILLVCYYSVKFG